MTDEPRFETASASDQITSKITITDNRTPRAQLLARIAELDAQVATARDDALDDAEAWICISADTIRLHIGECTCDEIIIVQRALAAARRRIRALKSCKGATP